MAPKRKPQHKAAAETVVYLDSDDEDDVLPQKEFYPHTITTVTSAGIKTANSAIASIASPQKKIKSKPDHSSTNIHLPSIASVPGLNVVDLDPDPTEGFDFLREGFFDEWDAEHELAKPKACTALLKDHPMKQWLTFNREGFLIELLRLDGHGNFSNHFCTCQPRKPPNNESSTNATDACEMDESSTTSVPTPAAYKFAMLEPMADEPTANEPAADGPATKPNQPDEQPRPAEYRCIDCLPGPLLCKECVVSRHCHMPLHRIQQWSGSYFECITLKSLGLRMQLNHAPGEWCLRPQAAKEDCFVIVDLDAIHEVALDFCSCHHTIPFTLQLLCVRLYPVTGTRPTSAVTFHCLRQFHLLSFQSKCSGYEYYGSIARGTDNTGTKPHPPSINLLPNWELAPEDKKFRYALFVGIDANFKLKRKQSSSEERDPSLGNHTCVSHDAVNKPDKEARGLAASGAGTIDCSRHDLKRPLGVGDLQKGERYINMDYMFFNIIRNTKVQQQIEEWEHEQWKPARKAPNPFKSTTKAASEQAVRLELAKEVEAQEAADASESSQDIHPSVMIANGLVIEHEHHLRRKITAWIEIQTMFMPEAFKQRAKVANAASVDGVTPTKAQDIALWLPSSLKAISIQVSKELQIYEWKLREGQGYDALEDIRRSLHLRSYLFKHKDKNS
ncbi:hypothetical protein H0H81_012536 [Sphagnurus paluster]|uniref:CxC2-like cysteine cluster KDZ transposase-associated domain-containing protein n=1 Tax=Sphagnurus paluster TaxID=117069 RepID=A0A9P7KJ32_9AGAR|nr:hypothetical protein H0H81_012536 [Sphagnurus paluster]